MHIVFLTPYKKTYSSDYCSLSTFIGFVFLILSIFLPLFAALSSEDFWLRLKEYLEQPKVEFTNDYMLYVSFLDSSTKTEKTFFYSSNFTAYLLFTFFIIKSSNSKTDKISFIFEIFIFFILANSSELCGFSFKRL